MTFLDFLRSHRAVLRDDWVDYARAVMGRGGVAEAILEDHVTEILDALVEDLEHQLTPVQRGARSRSRGFSSDSLAVAARVHATSRFASNFSLEQVVSEYRVLRASVAARWAREASDAASDELARFHEAIDELVAASIAAYTVQLERSRNLLLGTLGHDLRAPLNSIALTARAISHLSLPDEARPALRRIQASGLRMGRLVGDLLDMTRIRLGSGLDLAREGVDLGELCEETITEMRATYPRVDFRVKVEGDVRGNWDRSRLQQMLANLIGNAAQHGFAEGIVTTSVVGSQSEVTAAVHNFGVAIPAEFQSTIFEPMRRQTGGSGSTNRTDSVGLGLYIANEIVRSHGGSIDLTSTDREGTTFMVHLPRAAPS